MGKNTSRASFGLYSVQSIIFCYLDNSTFISLTHVKQDCGGIRKNGTRNQTVEACTLLEKSKQKYILYGWCRKDAQSMNQGPLSWSDHLSYLPPPTWWPLSALINSALCSHWPPLAASLPLVLPRHQKVWLTELNGPKPLTWNLETLVNTWGPPPLASGPQQQQQVCTELTLWLWAGRNGFQYKWVTFNVF